MTKPPKFSTDTFDTGWDRPSWTKADVVGTPYTPCYKTHKPLTLSGGLVIHGGSCLTPAINDADVYVGLDQGFRTTTRSWPWAASPAIEVYFPIPDMGVPQPKDLVKLVEWLAGQVIAGRKCHVGCIGGHGRTGMVLAALSSVMLGEKDAITYVRANYCPKAVESTAQVKMLASVFGIKEAPPAKVHETSKIFGGSKSGSTKTKADTSLSSSIKLFGSKIPAMKSAYCLWGHDAKTSSNKDGHSKSTKA